MKSKQADLDLEFTPPSNAASHPKEIEVSPSEKILEGLNKNQREAVLHGEGPLLIVAGAGTGKTTVLAKRIAYLITSKKALPSEILALTFTDKAAQEMEARVDQLVPYGFNDVWVSTFHSFGDRILREQAFEIGLSPDLRVLTQPEAVVFVRQNLFQFKLDHYRPLSEPTKFVGSLLTTFSRAKDEEATPQDYLDCAENAAKLASTDDEKEEAKKHLEVAEAYRIYEELKTKMGFIDFGDQVLLCLKIFREHPSVLKKVQARFKYILVDEFQDTNYAQFQILKLLAEPHKNITVVGDDDQSIYKFRGACLANILNYRKTYPNPSEIVLQENYRSTQEILDAAYKLIKHNNPDRLEYRDNLNKFLHSQKGSGKAVHYTHFDTLFSESEFIASEIKKRIESGASQPKDFAILVRTNAGAEPFIKSLNLLAIPWQFSGSAGLYEQEEVRIALAFLRVLDQPNDSASLYYLAVSPLYELEAEDAAHLSQLSAQTKRPLLEVFKDYRELNRDLRITSESQKKVEKIAEDIKSYRALSTKMPTGNLLYRYFEESGVLKKLADSTDFHSLQQAQNLHRFFEIIKKFGQVCQYDRVHYFIEYIESLRLAGDDPSTAEASFDENAVNILTVHAAKGLEFPVVFLAGLEQNHFPLTDRGEKIELPEKLIKEPVPSGNVHIQEERRLFYVGLTRAKEELMLCSAQDYGKKKIWKSSQFVLESLDKPEVNVVTLKQKPLESLKIFSADSSLQTPPIPVVPSKETENAPVPAVMLSATSVEEYLACPLKYKFNHLLKIPVLPHHTAVFGTAIHEALKVYHMARKEKRKIGLQTILDVFKRAWRSVGFISREHEEKRFQEGVKTLKNYYKTEEKSKTRPALIEEDFKMAVDQAKIRGRWDRIDMDETESVIIDYKTGDVKDQKDADKKAKESNQLGLYAIAFQNRFNKLPDKMVLSFVKTGLKGTTTPAAEKIEKVMESTRKVIGGISNQRFDPTPGYHCRWCAYEKICPAADRG